MNSKQTPTRFRALGQRSIASAFGCRSSNPFKKTEGDVKEKESNNSSAKKDSCVSLSDFLDQKLHKSSVLPKTEQGKSNPFSTPVGLTNVAGFSDGLMGIKKDKEQERNNVLDKVVFEQFKHTSNEEDTVSSCCLGNVDTTKEVNMKELRKRSNPFEDAFSSKKPIVSGADEKHTNRKPFLVLGDDSKRKRKGRGKSLMSSKKPKPSFNHYANGCGWWDCSMEGVDDEEVGFGEVWEGVGSTTFGGIEWH